uniref:Uncharacterized protein n=1 Tax=Dulem virus 196 TaxID=3145673 RepID=A0AAU8B954_9VIRU
MAKRKKISKSKSQSMFRRGARFIESFNLMPKPQHGGYRV